jgi:hypothetical protein
VTSDKTRMVNRLRALLLTGHDADRMVAHGSMNAPTLTTIIRRRGRLDDTREDSVAGEARRLALGIREADQALVENRKQLAALVTELAPTLLTKVGIGPVSAAQPIVSWSHHGRCRNDAAFAALAGASPIPASSGPTIRHRLNRGGTVNSTGPCTTSCSPAGACAPAPTPTSPNDEHRAKPTTRSVGNSSATSPARSTAPSTRRPRLDNT